MGNCFEKFFMWNRRPRRFLKRAGEGACSTYILVPKLPLGNRLVRQALLGFEAGTSERRAVPALGDYLEKFDVGKGVFHGLEARAAGAAGPCPLPRIPPNPLNRDHWLCACASQARCLCSK